MDNQTYRAARLTVPRIAGGEAVEIPIFDVIRTDFPASAVFERFSCRFALSYSYRLIFFSRKHTKAWDLELRPRPDGYSWVVKNAKT